MIMPGIEASLGSYQAAVDTALSELAAQRVLPRLWAYDHTLWKPEPREITNRLGWLHCPEAVQPHLSEMLSLVHEVHAAGYQEALLLGMGGSSLAPELYSHVFGPRLLRQSPVRLQVLDSTHPTAVLTQARRLNARTTLFLVSTKSGGTVETFSFFKYFYNWVATAVGDAEAGAHFIAITDPGSVLADVARAYHFRAIFLSDPNIGGRYSALSSFGLVPAALVGVDVPRLLQRSEDAARACGPDVVPRQNPAAHLGAILGELAKAGCNKVTFVLPPGLSSVGDWVEQLIAESLGKEGRGVVPVVDEPLGTPDTYGNDRCFVQLHLSDAPDPADALLDALQRTGHPVVHLRLGDVYDVGSQFFLWALATAVAGQRLGVNPFDQPNVEAAKVRAREMLATYTHSGALPALPVALTGDGMAVVGDTTAHSPAEALRQFLYQARPGDYVALQAYVPPNAETDMALLTLRTWARDQLKVATTVGYGPRFLHSTGQLHKGDAGQGLFIQFTSAARQDVAIPDEPGASASAVSFGTLIAAQSLGDRQALLEAGRRVMRIDLGEDVVGNLKRLGAALQR